MPSRKFPFPHLKTQWRRLSIPQRGAIAITIPLLCLVTSLSSHLWLRQRSLQVEQSVDHSQTVLLESHQLLMEMLNAETAVRGYYITRQSDFLQPYNQALTTLPGIFDRLKRLLQDNPHQVEQINRLTHLADQKLEILRAGIQYAAQSPLSNPQINAQLAEGKTVMDQFRQILLQLEAEQQQVLGEQQHSLQEQRDFNILVILLGVLLSSLGAAVAIGLFKDLDYELRQRELRLQESHGLIRTVFANMVDGVAVLNAQAHIEEFNRAAEQMFGYALSDLVGRPWMDLFVPTTEGHENRLLSLTEPSSRDRPWQALGQRRDGTRFPVEVSVSAIPLDDRRVVIIRDITERHQAAAKLQGRADELVALNAELSATNQTLSERNRELDQFAYVVSHDLKAPLRAIANLSAWIEEDLADQLPPENQKHMQLLRGRVHRMEALLNGLLEYARIGRIEIAVEAVDVGELIAHTIQTIAPPSTFQFHIGAPMPLLQARRFLLQQVFINLIENAVDHHPTERGIVKISVQDQGDRYEFAIADDGKGIDPRFYDKIYTIFQTLQARDTYESRGVGLAMVKKIVEMEGGTIHVESSVGQGSTFRFTWPKHPLDLGLPPVTFMPIDRSV